MDFVNPTGESTEDSGTADIFRMSQLKDNTKVRIRLLAGPYTLRQIYYPTIAVDEANRMQFTMRTITLDHNDPYNHTFSAISKYEKQIQAEGGTKDPKPRLRASKTFIYVGIIRGTEAGPAVTLIELKFRLQEQLEKIQKQESEREAGKLLNGPYFLYDLIVSKNRDPNKSKFTGTTYNLQIADPQTLYELGIANQIPANMPLSEIPTNFGELIEKSFDEKDKTFLNSAEGNDAKRTEKVEKAEEFRTAWDHEKVVKQLEECPLNLFAFSDGKFEFYNPKELYAFAQEKTEIPLLDETRIKQLQDEVKTYDSEKEDGITDTKFTEVDDTKPAEGGISADAAQKAGKFDI